MKTQLARGRLPQLIPWAVLLFAAILGVAPLIPPAAAGGDDSTSFSVARAFQTIETVAMHPRPIGSPENQRVRTLLASQLKGMGLETDVQIIEVPNYYDNVPPVVEIGNVVARLPGTAPTTAVAIVAHLDTVPTTPGANDNASGVAIALESARAILAGEPLRNDLILVLTDAEEPAPRYGSSAFVAQHPWANDIGFVINLESAGETGQSILTQINGPQKWLIDQYTEAVKYPAAYSFLTTMMELLGGSNTDFSTFKSEAVAGVEFAYVTGSPIYHTPADHPGRVSLRSLYQQGANTLDLARQLGDLDFDLYRETSAVAFFNVGRRLVVHYPIAWTLPILLLTGLLLVAVAWRLQRRRAIFGSAAITLVVTIAAAVLSAAIWMVLARQRETMAVAESVLYLFALAALIAAIVLAIARATVRLVAADAAAAGVVSVWWGLGLLTALTAPGMSYLFLWPALAGAATLLWRLSANPSSRSLPLLTSLPLGMALILFIPAVDILYQFSQPRPGNTDSEVLFVIAIPAALIALLVALFCALCRAPSHRFSSAPLGDIGRVAPRPLGHPLDSPSMPAPFAPDPGPIDASG